MFALKGMLGNNKIQKVLLPELKAEEILLGLYMNARQYADKNDLPFVFANVFIPKVGGTVVAEVQINELDATVQYMVGCNPDDQTDYLLLDFKTALSDLRGYLASEVIFWGIDKTIVVL